MSLMQRQVSNHIRDENAAAAPWFSISLRIFRFSVEIDLHMYQKLRARAA